MQKIFFFASIVLLAVIILPQLQLASAQEIPENLRNEIKLWANNQADGNDFLNTIAELRQAGFLKSNPSSMYSLNTYYLPAYGTTQFVQIQGRTPNVGQTNPITIIVTNPDRATQELSIPVLESGAYYTTIPLDHNSPLGKYEIVVYHGNKQIRSSEFYLIKSASTPAWIKSTARWWIEDKISDQEFLDGLDYLIKNNIIVTVTTDNNFIDILDITVDGQKAVRRGTTQDLNIHVQNSKGDVDGATVFVRVEDYGENVVEEFKGITDSDGNYDVSWEISKDIPNLKTFLVFVDVTDGISSETKLFTFQVYCLCGEQNCKCRN